MDVLAKTERIREMSDYAWFAVKGIGYLILIGFAIWLTNSVMPLWALLLMPGWTDDTKKGVGK